MPPVPITLRALTQELSHTLAPVIRPLDQRWFEAELLIGHILKRDRTWIALHPDQRLTSTQVKKIRALGLRRAHYEPLAYLFQTAPFFGRSFFVNAHVLIPRPESEWLVKQGTSLLSQGGEWAILDIGTGSGCLGLSLALSSPGTPALLTDASPEALTVAKKNAKRLQVQSVRFAQGSLITSRVTRWFTEQASKRWLIIANLPYLPFRDKASMQKQVIHYEPLSALFAKKEGLELIEQLLVQLQAIIHSRRGDYLLLEHDPRQARTLLKMAKNLFPQARINTEKDQNNAPRFTMVQF